MKMMKKWICLCLSMLLSCPAALAVSQEELTDYAVANGTVGSVEFIDITAPCSGTLNSFTVEAGDAVLAGDVLFSMQTSALTAPEEGYVSFVFAQPGQSAQDVLSRYGSLLAIEPAQDMRIRASTMGAHNKDENKILHVGEMLYFKSTGADKEEGTGRVISVSGENYVVDILTGDFELDESLTLYRDDDYETRDNVGKGKTARRDPISVTGMGVVVTVDVEAGDKVEMGQTLVTLMGADADFGASPLCAAQADGVVAMVAVSAGQQVWKGQVLARVYCTDAKEIVAQVDEVYLNGLEVGDTLPVTLDTDENTIFDCKVTEISALGATIQNAAYYTVRLALPNADDILLGQSAKVYLPKN